MRFGDVILLSLLALIGFGFCLAYSIDASTELTEARDQLARMQAEHQSLQAQYQSLIEKQDQLVAQMTVLTREKADLQLQVESLENERRTLSAQVETLEQQLVLINQVSPLLGWLDANPIGRLAAIMVVPMVPLSLGAVYMMAHAKVTRLPLRRGMTANDTFHVTLTREELHLIERRRRSRPG